MNFSTVWLLVRHELRSLMRDRRTVVVAIVLPLLIAPLILYSQKFIADRRVEKRENTVYHYAVIGDRADWVRELVQVGQSHHSEEVEKGQAPSRFQEMKVDDAREALKDETLHLLLETVPPDTVRKEAWTREEGEPTGPDLPGIRIVFQGDRDASEAGSRLMLNVFEKARTAIRENELQAAGFPLAWNQVWVSEVEDVASQEEVSGLAIGRFLTLFIAIFILMGGSVVSADAIAGEKERGTLETLLTTAVGRRELVTAKHMSIVIVALFVTLIQLLNLLVYVGFGVIPLPQDVAVAVSPAKAVMLLITLLPMVSLVSSLLLWISGRSNTYKETQLYFFPLFLGVVLLCTASMLPEVSLQSLVLGIPISNTAVAVREILVGKVHWLFWALAWLVTAAAAALVARVTYRSLAHEHLLSPHMSESNPLTPYEAFQKQVWIWVGVIWVVLFSVANNVSSMATLQRQALFNLVLLMGGGTFLMIRKYRLIVPQVLALRPPRPIIWLAVIPGIVAGLVCSSGIFRLSLLVLPLPPDVLQSFGQMLMPKSLSLPELLLFVAVLPAIFEELLFRGLLLHGAIRRMHPILAWIAVSLVFAAFHVALFRLVPTAFLGLILGGLTLLTGSVWPAIVWHFGNNALSVIIARLELPMDTLEPIAFMAAALALVLTFLFIYRHRTPYPGLRWPKSRSE